MSEHRGVKRCCRCEATKPRAEFYADRRSSDGLRGHCKQCHLAESTAYNEAHRDVTRAAGRKWYSKQRDDPKFLARAATRARAWNTANRERHRERSRKWYRDNRERALAFARNLPTLDATSHDYVAVLRSDVCCYCGGPMEDVDHIEPIVRGGQHHWTNLTAACGTCNNRKYSHPLLAFLASA